MADAAEDVEAAAVRLAEAVARTADRSWREGVHPRLGALDVVPFVALSGTPEARASAVRTAQYFAGWLGDTLDVPIFLYDEADPQERPLPQRSEEHTSELQSLRHLVCRLLLEKKNNAENIKRRTENEETT